MMWNFSSSSNVCFFFITITNESEGLRAMMMKWTSLYRPACWFTSESSASHRDSVDLRWTFGEPRHFKSSSVSSFAHNSASSFPNTIDVHRKIIESSLPHTMTRRCVRCSHAIPMGNLFVHPLVGSRRLYCWPSRFIPVQLCLVANGSYMRPRKHQRPMGKRKRRTTVCVVDFSFSVEGKSTKLARGVVSAVFTWKFLSNVKIIRFSFTCNDDDFLDSCLWYFE